MAAECSIMYRGNDEKGQEDGIGNCKALWKLHCARADGMHTARTFFDLLRMRSDPGDLQAHNTHNLWSVQKIKGRQVADLFSKEGSLLVSPGQQGSTICPGLTGKAPYPLHLAIPAPAPSPKFTAVLLSLYHGLGTLQWNSSSHCTSSYNLPQD